MAEFIQYDDFFGPNTEANFRAYIQKLGDIARSETKKIVSDIQNLAKGVTNELSAANIKSQAQLTTAIDKGKVKIEQINAVEKERIRLANEYASLSAKYATSQDEINRRNEEYRQHLNKINTERRIEGKLNNEASGSYNKMSLELAKYRSQLRSLSSEEQGYTQKKTALIAKIKEHDSALKKMDADMGLHQRNVGNYKSALSGLGSQLTSMVAGYVSLYGVLQLVQSVFTTTKELDVLSQSYKYLITDEKELAETQGYLSDITKKYGLEIISTSQSYLKFRASIAGANFDLKEAQKIFESTAKAGAVLGLNAQRMELIFLALEQMISKGTISSEELRRQLGDNLPGAMQIMARALGVTVPKLMEMLKANEVLASDALPKFRKELEKTYGLDKIETIDNMQASVNRLKNGWTNFVKNIGASKNFTSALDFLGRLFNNLSGGDKQIKKSINLYGLYNTELINLFSILKDNNTSLEVRKKVIEEINEKYGKYLPNLLTEKSSLGDIEQAYISINKQMRLNILQKAYSDEITAILQKELKAQESIVNSEIKRGQIAIDRIGAITEADALSLEQNKKILETSDRLNQITIKNTDGEIKNTKDKFKKIAEIYKIAFAEIENIVEESTTNSTPSIGIFKEIDDRIEKLNELLQNTRDKRQIIDYKNEIKALTDLKKYYEDLNFIPETFKDMKQKYETLEKAVDAAGVLGWSPERTEGIKREKEALENLMRSYDFATSQFKLQEREDIVIPKDSFKKYGDDWVQSIDSINKNISRVQKEYDEAETEAERKRLKERFGVLEYELKSAMGETSFFDEILIKVGIDETDLDKTKDALTELKDSLFDLAGAWADYMAETARNEYETHKEIVDDLKSSLNEQQKLKDDGKANDYDRLVTQIGAEQKLKDEALEKYKKAQKIQAAVDLAAQGSQLTLAMAEIFAANAKLGPWGVITAIAGVTSMLASFISFQSKIKSINSDNSYAEGTEYLERKGAPKGKDTIRIWANEGERIVPTEINNKLEGIDNEKLPEIYKLYKYNMLRGAGGVQINSYGELVKEMKQSRKTSEQMLDYWKNKPDALDMGDGKIMLVYGQNKIQIVNLKK